MRELFFAFIVAGILFVSCREEKMQAPYTTGMEGKAVPDFAIQLLDSASYLHSKDLLHGKQLVIFYYSPTCPYCRAQMRDMVNNMETFEEKQLCILTDADLHSIRQFARYFKLDDYPNVVVGRDTGAAILREFRAVSVPFTAFFDKNNDLKVAYSGRLRANGLRSIK